MATLRGGDKFGKKIREIGAKIETAEVLRVGFLENAKYPDGTPVAMIAAIQNYGAPAAGIPPRPFFSNMIASKKAGWPGAVARNLKQQDYDATRAFALVGEGIAGQLRQSIIQTNSPPLKAATAARKGSTKPLVDTGHMLASVDYDVR